METKGAAPNWLLVDKGRVASLRENAGLSSYGELERRGGIDDIFAPPSAEWDEDVNFAEPDMGREEKRCR